MGHCSLVSPAIIIRTLATLRTIVSSWIIKLCMSYRPKNRQQQWRRPPQKLVPVLMWQKIMAPQTLDQSERDKVCGPAWSDKINHDKGIVGLIEKISSQQVSAQIKIKVMHRAVATCPKVNMGCGRKRIPSLLDSGGQVTLICKTFLSRKSCLILNHQMGKNRSVSAVSADSCQ